MNIEYFYCILAVYLIQVQKFETFPPSFVFLSAENPENFWWSDIILTILYGKFKMNLRIFQSFLNVSCIFFWPTKITAKKNPKLIQQKNCQNLANRRSKFFLHYFWRFFDWAGCKSNYFRLYLRHKFENISRADGCISNFSWTRFLVGMSNFFVSSDLEEDLLLS